MKLIRNRARLIAAIALAGNVAAVALVSMALSCDPNAASASGHEGMENCPLHERAPECSVHGDQHGTHACDCPTIGCSNTDAGLMALLGAVAVLPASADTRVAFDAAGSVARMITQTHVYAHVPLAPPPRA
jgi:hypothetical protein